MNKIIIKNKYINYNYYIIEKYISGIILFGWEVKLIRERKIDIKNSYIEIKNNEAFLININLNINKKNIYYKNRKIKILLHKYEIKKINLNIKKNSYTIVLSDIHENNKLIKCTICIVKGKKKYEKRNIIKEKIINKELKSFNNI